MNIIDAGHIKKPEAIDTQGDFLSRNRTDKSAVKLNLGCGPHQIFNDHINVDITKFPGVDIVQDLFLFPWASLQRYEQRVEAILCNHLVEHIPHDVHTPTDYPLAAWDGFYCFFYECWKLLIPGGRMELSVPHARSNGAFQDPTHRRFLVENTFSYLDPETGYRPATLPFGFTQLEVLLSVDPKVTDSTGVTSATARDAIETQWNTIVEFKVVLEALK